MASHAISIDELQYRRFFDHSFLLRASQSRNRDRAVRLPMNGLVRNLEVAKNLLVESVFAFEQRLQTAQEGAGLGALHHPMIVGAGDRHHFAQAQLSPQLVGHAVILGRIVDGAGGDDRALARHQARH